MSPTAKRRRCAKWVHTILYFNRTLFSHGNFTETERLRQTGYSSAGSTDYVSPENARAAQFAREDFRGLTMADVERQADQMPWGTADEVTNGSSTRPRAPAPTPCRSASIAGCCRTKCLWSRSAASPPRCPPGTSGVQSRACAIGRGSSGLAEQAQFHGDMRDPEIVKGRAGRFEPVASIKRNQMGLSGQHHRQTWILRAVK